MRKVVLYIATSLDGYIADKNSGVSWLSGDGSDNENMGSYQKFYETIDTVISGYNTYHQIVTELSPENWVYSDKKTYVITHRKQQNTHNILFTDDLISLVEKLKGEQGKDIWICGGASVINQLLSYNLIDKITLCIIPIILGDGIRLFEKCNEHKLRLISTESYNGITDLVYEKRI